MPEYLHPGVYIEETSFRGKPIEAGKTYKVAGWAPVAEGAKGEPVWEVISTYLRDRKTIAPPKLSLPRLVGVEGNPGIG